MAISRPSRVSPAARGSSTVSAAGILPRCHRTARSGSGTSPAAPPTPPPSTRGRRPVPYGGPMDHERQLAPSPFPGDEGLADPLTRRALASAVADGAPTSYLRAIALL